MDNPNIVVIGATGTVGTIFLDLLEDGKLVQERV